MKFLMTLLSAFNDSISDKTRTIVTSQEVKSYCEVLAETVAKVYTPDMVVAIDIGGSVPGELVAQYLGVPVEHIVVRREIKELRRYGNDPVPIRWMMSFYHHYLFQKAEPVVSEELQIDVSGKRVLIVDDAMHTGSTVDVTKLFLRNAGVIDIKVVSLSYVEIYKPDFSILPKGNYCFPWSKDYKSD